MSEHDVSTIAINRAQTGFTGLRTRVANSGCRSTIERPQAALIDGPPVLQCIFKPPPTNVFYTLPRYLDFDDPTDLVSGRSDHNEQRRNCMGETVWVSGAPGHPSNMRPFRHDVAERGREHFDPIVERLTYGEPVAQEDLPKTVFAMPNARPSDYRLPDIFNGYGYFILSDAAAAVFSTVDLGDAAMAPVAVVQRDRQTPVGGDWFAMSIGNRKQALLPDQSPLMRHRYLRDGIKGWFPRATLGDGDIAVSHAALAGPEVWIDVDVGSLFFLSDRLVSGLKTAKATKGFS